MEITLKYRQGLLSSQIVNGNAQVTICELDGGGEIVGTVTLVTDPENLIDLGQDIIMAALRLKQQLAQDDPFSDQAKGG